MIKNHTHKQENLELEEIKMNEISKEIKVSSSNNIHVKRTLTVLTEIESKFHAEPIIPSVTPKSESKNAHIKRKRNHKKKLNADSIEIDIPTNLYDNAKSMTPIKGNRKKSTAAIRSMRSDHCFKELEVSTVEGKLWDEELYATRIATLSMMEDAVEAKTSLEITNRKLLEEIAERTRSEKIQEVLYAISNAALTAGNVDDLITIFRDQLGKLLDTTNFYIAFYNEATGMLSTSNASDEMDSIDSWPAEKSLTGLVIQQKKSLLLTIDDIKKLSGEGIISVVGTTPMVWMGVPLLVDGKVTGAFAIQNYHNSNAYTSRDMDMLEFISNQISISIERKKSVQDLKAALLKAEENDRLKTAFLHNISHEIRTPMNAIIGFSGFLNDPGIKQADMLEYTEIICNASHQLLSIIEDIINISTVEAGQETLRNKDINLNALLTNLNKQFQAKFKTSDIELRLSASLPDELSQITTDETKLMQILTNLLNNACKFTKKGLVSFGYELKAGNLEFYVEDTGIGIAQNMHTVIFERFRQADSSIAREFGGTGLGLSISKAYVELLGGKIWLTSTVGSGTTFRFSIPFIPVKSTYKSDKISNEPQIIRHDIQKVVLVAEDEKYNYMLLNKMLKDLNFIVLWAHNGVEALGICKSQQNIDLVFMDLKMPVMDGFEATIAIRELFPDMPIIAQTAYTNEKERLKIFECGCNDIITKPIDVNDFNTIINKYLAVAEPTLKELRPLY